nr:proton-conducting transporter membrane subunit [Halorhodospira abdelmalekii]
MAADLATFYFAYATMTLAAYPLIIHQQTPQAQRAGRVYLAMAVLAEGVLLSAVLMIAGAAGNPQLSAVPEIIAAHPFSDWLVLLLGVGFAVKAGAVPLHVWLPLAHPAAPIPASALLSGLLVKAALVGWLRLLPLGEAVWPTFAAAALAVAVVTVLYANLVGLTQRRAKTVLAYSTVSQMGLLIAMVGLAALVPAAAPVAFAAALLFAVHHGLAKGALFLSCAFAGRRSAWRYALLPALALAGAPLSSGAVAKAGLKEVGEAAALEALVLSLSFASLLTTLLMARLLWLLYRQGVESPQEGEQRGGEWLTRATVLFTVAASLTVPWLLAGRCCPTLLSAALQPSALWAAAWPLLLGSALVVAALFGGYALWRRSLKSRSGNRGDDHTRDRIRDYIDSHSRDSRGQPWTVPEGDWIKPALLGGVRLARRLRRLWRRAPPRPPLPAWGVVGARWSAAIESRLVALAMAGALFLVLVLGISVLGMWAGR